MNIIVGGYGLFLLILSLLLSVIKFHDRSEEWVYRRAVVFALQAIALFLLVMVLK